MWPQQSQNSQRSLHRQPSLLDWIHNILGQKDIGATVGTGCIALFKAVLPFLLIVCISFIRQLPIMHFSLVPYISIQNTGFSTHNQEIGFDTTISFANTLSMPVTISPELSQDGLSLDAYPPEFANHGLTLRPAQEQLVMFNTPGKYYFTLHLTSKTEFKNSYLVITVDKPPPFPEGGSG